MKPDFIAEDLNEAVRWVISLDDKFKGRIREVLDCKEYIEDNNK